MRFLDDTKIISIIVVMLLLVAVKVDAKEWIYLVNNKNELVARLDYSPSLAELESRDLIAVRSSANISLKDGEYRGGRIVLSPKTAGDLQEESDAEEREAEMIMVHRKSLLTAYNQLVADGVTFNQISSKDFE